MKDKEKPPGLKLRKMIEALCEGIEEFWHVEDGQRVVNVYQLKAALDRWASESPSTRKAPSQSTLARCYSGFTENFSRETALALSDFFRVPRAVITGDLDVSSEAWGMDINVTEIRWIMLLRELTPEQRTAVYNTIRAMLPPDTPTPRLPPGSSPLAKPAKH